MPTSLPSDICFVIAMTNPSLILANRQCLMYETNINKQHFESLILIHAYAHVHAHLTHMHTARSRVRTNARTRATIGHVEPPRDRSRDRRQLEVDCGLFQPLFNQSEARICLMYQI